MKATLILILLFLIAVANFANCGQNLSEMISDTYPITRKCPPINGEKAIQLSEDTPASVYFRTKGWQSGYLAAGETVYYDPRTLCMTRMVRCGNSAQGRVKLPMTPKPEVEVCYKTRIMKCPPEKIMIPASPVPAPTVITNNYFSSVPVMSPQIGGQSPYMNNSMQLMSVSLYPMQDTNITLSVTASAPTTITNTNNNSNANTNINPNNNVINVGPGSASGTAAGNGNSNATSGDP